MQILLSYLELLRSFQKSNKRSYPNKSVPRRKKLQINSHSYTFIRKCRVLNNIVLQGAAHLRDFKVEAKLKVRKNYKYWLLGSELKFTLSKELLYIIIAQGAAKLWPVKVGGQKKVELPRSELSQASQIYLIKLASNPKCLIFIQTSNFDRSQFCSPLAHDDA